MVPSMKSVMEGKGFADLLVHTAQIRCRPFPRPYPSQSIPPFVQEFFHPIPKCQGFLVVSDKFPLSALCIYTSKRDLATVDTIPIVPEEGRGGGLLSTRRIEKAPETEEDECHAQHLSHHHR